MPQRLFGRKAPSNGSTHHDDTDAAVPEPAIRTVHEVPPGATPSRPFGQSPFPPHQGGGAQVPSSGFRPDPPRRVYDVAVPPYRRLPNGNGHGPALQGHHTEPRKLIVGRDISLSGEISACDMLIVEGKVEATLRDGRLIEISETGHFKGSVEIDEADLGGRFEGTLVVRGRMRVRSTGRVHGIIRYGELEVEAGGQIVGDVQVASPGCFAGLERKSPMAEVVPTTMQAVPAIAE